jgi:hypothetical protein
MDGLVAAHLAGFVDAKPVPIREHFEAAVQLVMPAMVVPVLS